MGRVVVMGMGIGGSRVGTRFTVRGKIGKMGRYRMLYIKVGRRMAGKT